LTELYAKIVVDLSYKKIYFIDLFLNNEDIFNKRKIENYIKSVLSTHTVLFLGYSYNDVNLKLIIQWLRNNIQNKIINRPAMYIVNFQTHSNQITYFKKQGITTITLSDINNTLIDIDKYDANSRMVYTFLDKIFTGIDRIALIGTDEINNYILSRLIPFEGLHAILIDQIQSALSNCGFQFDADGKAILEFYEKLLTGDIYNRGAVREVYKLFIQEINGLCNGDKPSESALRIINILSKSDIKGIFLESDSEIKNRQQFLNFQSFLDIPSDNNILFSFDYSINSNGETIDILLRNAWAYYSQNKEKDSINCINKAICLCKTDNDYQKLFILMFNFNVLLRRLQFEPETKDEFKDIPKYNLEQRFNNLTYLQQETVRPVYDFVNFTTVYGYLYNSVNDLNKIADQIQNIKAGGFSYSSNVNQYSGRHSNLIRFVLANDIFIEDYDEYKTINKNLVEIAVLRQYQQNTATFTRIELYSCIRYFDDKELKQLLEPVQYLYRIRKQIKNRTKQ
jgi:hypothetical protein